MLLSFGRLLGCLVVVVGIAAVSGCAHRTTAALTDIAAFTLAANLTRDEVSGYVEKIGRTIEPILEQKLADAHEKAQASGGDVSILTSHERELIARKLAEVPKQHVAVLCAVASNPNFKEAKTHFLDAVVARGDYDMAQRSDIVGYLPTHPRLIHVMHRMGWCPGAENEMKAGWQIANKVMRGNGVMSQSAYSYACIAAKYGVKETLIVLAERVRDPRADAGTFLYRSMAKTLMEVVPSPEDNVTKLAQRILEEQSGIEFDVEKRVYRFTEARPGRANPVVPQF